jgi:hypothetical protein
MIENHFLTWYSFQSYPNVMINNQMQKMKTQIPLIDISIIIHVKRIIFLIF